MSSAASPAPAPPAARIQLEPSWKERVGGWLERPEMRALSAYLRERKRAGVEVYPPGRDIFAAFAATPFDGVRGGVLGQAPYHGPGPAHGPRLSRRPRVPGPP